MNAILFDLDGVLIDSSQLHKTAFIKACAAFGLSVDEKMHDKFLEGLPTRKKISWLSEHLALELSLEETQDLYSLKQQYSSESFEAGITFSPHICEMIEELQQSGIKIGICSNSIRPTLNRAIELLDIKTVDVLISSDDVPYPKPHPQMFRVAMQQLDCLPIHTTIFEDSEVGILAARASGAHVVKVDSVNQMTSPFIWKSIDQIERKIS